MTALFHQMIDQVIHSIRAANRDHAFQKLSPAMGTITLTPVFGDAYIYK